MTVRPSLSSLALIFASVLVLCSSACSTTGGRASSGSEAPSNVSTPGADASPAGGDVAHHRGRIVALDPVQGSLVLRTHSGEDLQFRVGDGNPIEHQGEQLGFAALRLGQELEVATRIGVSGPLPADRIAILDPRSVAADVAAAPPTGVADTATITAVDVAARRFTISTPTGNETFRVGNATRILSGSRVLGLDELRTGDRVVVEALAGKPSPRVADRIKVVIDPSPR